MQEMASVTAKRSAGSRGAKRFFESKAAGGRKRSDPAENFRAQLFDAAAAVAAAFGFRTERSLRKPFALRGDVISFPKAVPEHVTHKGEEIPVRAILAVGAVVTAAGSKIGLADYNAWTFGARVIRELLTDLRVPASVFRSALDHLGYGSWATDFSVADVRQAAESLYARVAIDRTYDIPYLAGYHRADPSYVYLDRAAPARVKEGSASVDVRMALAVHEAFEKAIMAVCPFEDLAYLRPHQIAQRLEKAVVKAYGVSWKAYQGRAMRDAMWAAVRRAPKKCPRELDTTPYEELGDEELLRAMARKMRATSSLAVGAGVFDVRMPRPGLIWLRFRQAQRMAKTLVRIQERYENPDFIGKTFTVDEFRRSYRKLHGKFDYAQKYDGFNFPGTALRPFYRGSFDPLSADERKVLEALRPHLHAPFYVIATAYDSHPTTVRHEASHALFALDADYREAVEKAMKGRNLAPVYAFLREHLGDYHDKVLFDEAQAWLLSDGAWMARQGFPMAKYAGLVKKLRTAFVRYAPAKFRNAG